MNFIFLRHGRSDHNETGTFDSDIESVSNLTESGRENVRKSCLEIKKNYSPTIIYSSPLLRCRQTSRIVSEIFEIPKDNIIFDYLLREVEMGDFEGESFRTYPYGNYNHEHAHEFGGETLEDVIKRMKRFIKRLSEENKSGDIVIVTHQAPIRAATKILIGEDIKLRTGEYYIIKL
jgi:broad specificity phosphatase PhoE